MVRAAAFGRQPLGELLLTEEPTDMDWTLGADGQAQAWFFEDTTPRLVRCDLAAGKMRLERCTQVAAGAQLKLEPQSQAIHIAVDAGRQRIFIADAKGHAVQVLSLDGRVLGKSVTGDLFFPNRLRLAGDSLMVADNDHRRLVWLDVRQEPPTFALRKSLQAGAHPQALSGHTKVTDFAFLPGIDGQPAALWMLAVAQGQKNGTVLVWDAASKPVARAGLGGLADPLAMDRLGDAAVAADFEGVALYRIGAQGQYLGSFGDEGFQRELRSSREQIARASLWVKAGWGELCAHPGHRVPAGLALQRKARTAGRRAGLRRFVTGISRGAARDGGIETAGLVRQTGCPCRRRWNAAGAGGAGRSLCPLSL